MNMTEPEAMWLLGWLRKYRKKIPPEGRYQPHFDATSWDLDEILHGLREEALGSREAVSLVVLALTTGQKRKRLKPRDQFWLNARWDSAVSHCERVARTGRDSATLPTPPTDAPASIGWLLLECWEKQLAEEWVRENAREYIVVDDPTIQESVTELEIFLRRLEGTLPSRTADARSESRESRMYWSFQRPQR